MRHYEVLLLFRLSSDPWASLSLKVCMHMYTGGVSGAPNCKLFPLAAASTATACPADWKKANFLLALSSPNELNGKVSPFSHRELHILLECRCWW